MLIAYKVEIKPTLEQKMKINQSIGICRYLYNFYLAKNKELYQQFKDGLLDKQHSFMSANDFDKYINNEIKTLEEYQWINKCGSKARKKTICNAETAYKKFFKGESKFPRFKKKNKSDVKLYFPKNNKGDWKVYRHKIMIPSLKNVRLKEYGYIPINANIKSGTVSKSADRYYVSVLVETDIVSPNIPINDGVGIDLGLKDFAVISNGIRKKNINKTEKVKKLEKRLKREQRKLSRKYESLKLRNKDKKGDATRQNIQKQIAKVQKLHYNLSNIRTNYINKAVSDIVKQNPSFITIEDLNVSGMMKNKHLSKAVAEQKFFEFRTKLTNKCNWMGIELRIVDKFYPSSKLCHECGHIKKDLKLSDRIYKCECGYEEDRDINASFNLRDAKIYKIA
ncbi:IS200/IS605 family element transposase accessory protein TnpB [Clostridium argentinense]|nr:transposase [Clostridium argentinense]NFF38663.1 IS200/IS605 family element transposase accessory protein TnpB [Clostridium argentinense]NFP48888.1 IS200/IS605 family element transposase accessory protein TnpB [Clostridium argentinense]NFP72964.1 IS200/IS605 family element transposase accessory protein TnpB [Clostridium argentinense]NFP75668.1 IS200/IS605 family element transposase accessory protein TnpB [Clostridium argentinense]